MRTRSQARKRRQQQVRQTSVESPNLEKPNNNPPIVTMDDNRTMAQLLEAPTEGYEDAIVVPEITANNFEIKHGLLNLVQNKQFFGHDKEDPHAHIRYFNKITSTMKFPNVPSTSVKLMLFPFSLEGAARIWLEKEPPRSILTWDESFRNSPSNTITNPKEDLKGITTRSGVAYQGPTIPSTSSSSPKVMNRDTEIRISFTDALPLCRTCPRLYTLIGNKEKLSEMARTPLNERRMVFKGGGRRSGVTTSSRGTILSSLLLLLSGEGGLVWYGPSLGTPYANSSSDHLSVKTQAPTQGYVLSGHYHEESGDEFRYVWFESVAPGFCKGQSPFIVAHDRDVIKSNAVVDKSLFHP
ncbi:hypothetical protein Tco_0365151 [Tanacetum coccineum]